MKKGFSLIEVLVTLALLSIILLGIYSVLSQSMFVVERGIEKLHLVDKGFERILKQSHYPRLALSSSEEEVNDVINYEYKREVTMIPGVVKVLLRVKTESAMVTYEYFEKTK